MAKAGTAYVDIDAKLDKMRATLQRGTRNLKADLDLVPDLKAVRADLKAAKLTAELTLDVDRKEIAAQLANLTTDLDFDIDRTEIMAKLHGLRVDLHVDVDDSSLAAAKAKIDAELGHMDINVRLDVSSALALRAELQAILAGVTVSPGAGAASTAAAGGAGSAAAGAGLGTAALGAGLLGTASVVGVAGLGILGANFASDIEQANNSFRRLLGSAEKAEAFLRDLQAFAARTPFEMSALREYASQLLAVQVPEEDIIPLMEVIGDATSALGTGQFGIDRATYALMQMKQATKVTGMEMRQLTEAGIPAWEALAAEMGVTVPELKKMVSEGLVPAEKMFDAIKNRSGEAFKRIEGGMAEAATTLKGQLSNLKDLFEITLGKAAEPFMESLKEVVGLTIDVLMPSLIGPLQYALDKLSPVLNVLAKNLGPIIGAFLELGGVLLEAFTPALEAIMPTITFLIWALGQQLGEALIGMAPVFKELAKALLDLVVAMAPLIPPMVDLLVLVAPYLADALAFVADGIRNVLGAGIRELAGLFSDLIAGDWDAARDRLGRWGDALLGVLKKVDDWLSNQFSWWEDLKIVIANVAAGVMKAWDEAVEFFEKAWGKAADVFESKIKPRLVDVGEAVAEAWNDRILPALEDTGEKITTALSPDSIRSAWESLTEWWNTSARPAIETFVGFIQTKFAELKVWVDQNLGPIFDSLKEAVDALKPYFELGLGAVGAVIYGFVAGAQWVWENFGGTLINLVESAWNTIKGVIEGALKIIDGMIQVFTGVISGDWEKLWEGMKTIVLGAWQGIVALWGGFWDSLTAALYMSWETFKQAFIGMLNWIIEAWNDIDFVIDVQIPDWVPNFGGKGFKMDIIPDIPTLHSGGMFEAPPGTGEGLALLRHGEYVVTPEEIAAANMGGGSSKPVAVTQNIYGNELSPKAIGDFAMRRASRALAVHA